MLSGELTLRIICADSVSLLNALNAAHITLQDVRVLNDLELKLTVCDSDYIILQRICDKQGASISLLRKSGVIFWIYSFLKRPVMVISLVFGLILSLYLPGRILFIAVEGNSEVATKEILEAAEACGITFGAGRREVRSEKMKNALLEAVPDLQWAGINTSGCTAVISVKEKMPQEIANDKQGSVCSIVAARDGIIQSYTVYQGNPLCALGQAVKEGQVLVSGYTDCGIITKATQAQAEIKALTFREIEVVLPCETRVRGEVQDKTTRYSLRIGKNLIKFSKDSGNYDTTCAKIYEEEYVRLPGGFVLPIAIVKETEVSYDYIQQDAVAAEWLSEYAEAYLTNTMIAGEIISGDTELYSDENVIILNGKYACIEMIGKVKAEQMIEGE